MKIDESSIHKRRLFTRIPFHTNVMLNTLPGKHECSMIDISLRGALVERTLPWSAKIGDPCNLYVELAGGGTSIQMTGEIAHVEDGRLGIRCTEIDLESITNLRRLVELNLGDEEALNREISAMVRIGETD